MKEQKEKLQIILDACEDKKGIDTQVLEIGHRSSIGDYFVIVSGNSAIQVGALADEIDDKMAKAGCPRLNMEGQSSGRWIILDYGDIIVHVFHKEEREYYGLERLWQEPKEEE
ncbi:MAG: ribosome silencing factor [Tissierellia bacterium]|nr:ribosome silencing factor [Tissierellia bacterium]